MKYTEITDHLTACKVMGIDPNALPDFSKLPERHQVQLVADAMLLNIADAINKLDDNFQADFSNDERKWRPFFYVDASGLRFVDSGYVVSLSYTCVGSRLCFYFRSEAAADFFATQFIELHKKSFYGK